MKENMMYWDSSTPEQQGIDSEVLIEMLWQVKREKLDLHSIIIIRNKHLVLESYIHPYKRETLHNVKSVSKSIISALVGIALQDRIIDNLDQTVHDFLPQYITDEMDLRKKEITLWNLLTMTSGLELDENGPISDQIFGSDNWIKTALARKMSENPGEKFNYSTALTHTMSGILTEASGRSLLDLANEYLFAPLGINCVQWTRGPLGYYIGGAELWLTSQAMAEFGYLYLSKGKWESKQLIPPEWVEESTGNQLDTSLNEQYGYWWWTGAGFYSASGWGGQVIVVLPESNMVIVMTGADLELPRRLGFEFLSPAVKSSGSLPPNSQATETLNHLMLELQYPKPEPSSELPEMVKQISGVKYLVEGSNDYRDITLDFKDEEICILTLGTSTGVHELTVGLDGIYRISKTNQQLDYFGRTLADYNGKIACKGKWTNENTFLMDWHEIGYPTRRECSLQFRDDKMDVSIRVRPPNYHFSLIGEAETK